MSYDTIILNDSSGPLWQITDNFSNDVVAGMLAVIDGSDYYLTVGKDGQYNRVEFQNNDYLLKVVEDYNELADYNRLLKNYYGWWIINDQYKLYRFKTFDFIYGFITLASVFQIDFRDISVGTPFDKNGTNYLIAGYDIEPYKKINKVAPTYGFYMMTTEAGAFDYI